MRQKRAMTLMLFMLMTLLVALFVYIQNTTAFANRSMQLIMKNMGLNQFLIPESENPVDAYLCTDKQQLFPQADAVAMTQEIQLLSRYYVALLQQRMTLNGTEVILSGIQPYQRPDETAEKASLVKPVPAGQARVGGVAAERLGLSENDTLTIADQSFKVAKVLPVGGTIDDCRVYIPLKAAQKMLGAEGKVNALLSFECLHVGGSLDHIHAYQRQKLAELFPGYRQFNMKSIAEGRFYSRRMTKNYLECLSLIISLIAVIVIAICGFQDVAARKYETGVLIAMGASHRYIAGLYLIKILLLSLLASLIGFLIGGHLAVWLNAPFFISNTRQITLVWSNLPFTLLAGMGVALLGQLFPIIQLLQLDPHTILAED
jgi:putative ABC transport system permease protein